MSMGVAIAGGHGKVALRLTRGARARAYWFQRSAVTLP